MWYKVEVRTKASKDVINRFPSLEELQEAVEYYIERGQGIVNFHTSMYEYTYDTMLNDYHRVDSNNVIGHIVHTLIENDKFYIIVDFSKEFDPEKNYICFYRSIMQANPKETDRTLHITNLFAVDLVTVLDSELKENLNLSEVTVADGNWWDVQGNQ